MDVKENSTEQFTLQNSQTFELNSKMSIKQSLVKQLYFDRLSKKQRKNENQSDSEKQIQQLQKKQLNQELAKQEQMIPISHQKRQRSLSPIKDQPSIVPEQYFSINSPKVHLASIPKFSFVKEQNIEYSAIKPTPFKYSPALQNSRRFQKQKNYVDQKIYISGNRSKSRKTQIFSSDKKQHEKALTLNRNTVAEKILNQSRKQKNEKQQLQRKRSKQLQSQNSGRKPKRQPLTQLSKSKKKQIQKLKEIQQSPQKASTQYWQGIYPQSLKYISELKSVLSEQMQVLNEWQSQLHMTLRQNLYQIQDLFINKLYEICRISVKLWVQDEIQTLQQFFKSQFSQIGNTKSKIQLKQTELDQIQAKILQFNTKITDQIYTGQLENMIQRSIFSPNYTSEVKTISLNVKQVISESQKTVFLYCKNKIQKAQTFQVQNNQENLETKIYNLLRLLYSDSLKENSVKEKSQRPQIPALNIPLLNIEEKIQKSQQVSELNLRKNVQAKQTLNTQRKESRQVSPLSQRKSVRNGSIIKDNQKAYEQFKNQFQQRRKNFLTKNHYLKQADHMIKDSQKPISIKVQQNMSFDQKISNLLKKIDEKKQQPVITQRQSTQTNNHQFQTRQKKLRNRQNFFRYSMQ